MNAHIVRVALSLSLLVGATAHAFQAVAKDPSVNADAVITAADLVQAALQAEAAGDAAKRESLLREALDNDPEYAPARWHSGFVRLNDKWVSLAESQNVFRLDPRVADYRVVRKSLVESPTQDLLLARWCQANKLHEEAQFHWLNVLRVQPNHEEALSALNVQWYNGRLLKRDQVAAQKREDFKASRSNTASNTHKRRGEVTIASWERAASEGDSNLLSRMEGDLASEESPGAIPMFNILLGERSQAPKDPEALQIVSLNWLKILAKNPAHTKFLVMYAIGHPLEAVRIAAAEELKKQPREDYVPLLLACARFPVEVACNLLATGGLNSAQYTLDIQGLESDVRIEHFVSLERVAGLDVIIEPFEPGSSLFVSGGQTPDQAASVAAWQGAAAGNARVMKNYVDQYNAVSALINKRITDALTRATGEDVEADPRVWQAWWKEYMCDYYELEQRPDNGTQVARDEQGVGQQGPAQLASSGQQERRLQKYSAFSNQYVYAPPASQMAIQGTGGTTRLQHLPQSYNPATALSKYRDFRPPPPRRSCFKGSTLVWTITGPRPIKEIIPGDRVLSQSSSTGELAYKVVQQVTKRDSTPMVKITVGGEEIVSTLGHPFWVVGKRWMMAKHLQKGDLLHSVSGPLPIENIEEIPAATAWYDVSYNLQIDDFHTFFVGENQVLVHHLSMLSILDEGSSLVPGL
ncbi:MAG: polymorphic toxin-type HINT domain-containing protein [Pirellulaceae bacterium]